MFASIIIKCLYNLWYYGITIILLPAAPRKPLVSESEQRLAELVDSTQIEVISFEKDFARYMLELLIRSIVMGMVGKIPLCYSYVKGFVTSMIRSL